MYIWYFIDIHYYFTGRKGYIKKKTDRILRIFTFNDEYPLYLPVIWTLQFFRVKEIEEWPSSHKTICQFPNMKNSEFKLKKCQFFPSTLLFFIYIFMQYLVYILRPFTFPQLSMLLASIWESFIYVRYWGLKEAYLKVSTEAYKCFDKFWWKIFTNI